jgi:hypothetical protein
VAAKQERIVVGYEPSGEWDRHYEVKAAFDRPDGSSAHATVRVSGERYDALRAGDSIQVRYLPQLPALARTSDRTTAGVVRELTSRFAAIPIIAWLACGIAALWIAARIGATPVLAVAGVWAAAAWPMLFTPQSRERPRPAEAIGQVRAITLVDRAPSRVDRTYRWTSRFDTRLEVPYQVVELLVAAGSPGDTVVAVDAVDAGSVKRLAQGARLPVRIDPAAPRDAQLAGGTRRFASANRYHFVVPVIGSTILGALMGLAYGWRRTRRTKSVREHVHRNDEGLIPQGGA